MISSSFTEIRSIILASAAVIFSPFASFEASVCHELNSSRFTDFLNAFLASPAVILPSESLSPGTIIVLVSSTLPSLSKRFTVKPLPISASAEASLPSASLITTHR